MNSLGDLSNFDALTRIAGSAAGRWLDIGCGDGGLARQLAGLGAVVTGIEPDAVQADKNRSVEPTPGVTLLEGQAEALPIEDRSMDAVIFCFSLHHVPSRSMGAALSEARRVLVETGVLYVVEPLADGSFYRAIELFHDESAVRAAAIEALASHAKPFFRSEQMYGYSRISRYKSFAEFTGQMLALSYNHYDPQVVTSDAVRQRFEACRNGGEYVLEQPIRAYVFKGPIH